MKDYFKQTGKQKTNRTKEISEQIEKNKQRRQSAQQLMLDGELAASDCKEIRNRYEPEIEKLVSKQLQLKQQDST